MKKVRFGPQTSPEEYIQMDEDCHYPRPFMRTQLLNTSEIFQKDPDPIELFDLSDSCTYTAPSKYELDNSNKIVDTGINPSSALELSFLDSSSLQQPRRPILQKPVVFNHEFTKDMNKTTSVETHVLSSIENTPVKVPDNSFFINRDNANKLLNQKRYNLNTDFQNLKIDKFNQDANCKYKDEERCSQQKENFVHCNKKQVTSLCNCHHCMIPTNKMCAMENYNRNPHVQHIEHCCCIGNRIPQINHVDNNEVCAFKSCSNVCNKKQIPHKTVTMAVQKPTNAIEKKIMAVQQYEQRNDNDCSEVAKQSSITKDKREPTVADLFQIIKLQNEQLQLLQDKVDKFITAANNTAQVKSQETPIPVENIVTEQLTYESVENDHHKISIGVMTSFEVIRTSTVINKDFRKHSTVKNAQAHCNIPQQSAKSSNKPVETAASPVNVNFLDGITPVSKKSQNDGPVMVCNSMYESENSNSDNSHQAREERPYNDTSLYNVQVDNATTPLLSPDQTLYLDVRDYSDSDTGSDHSNVGWTYYNKVMTHVNGMLQDSDMPSSASALYRNTRQQCLQMQIDKTNISVTKRVKFGDDLRDACDPVKACTDTSMKMNLLAAKYLKNELTQVTQKVQRAPAPASTDMSIATRNYMERHHLLPGSSGVPVLPKPSQLLEMPRFLDVTALKQQPKLL